MGVLTCTPKRSVTGVDWKLANNLVRNPTMRATLIYGAGDVRVETVPNPTIQEPTDAIVRIVAG